MLFNKESVQYVLFFRPSSDEARGLLSDDEIKQVA